MDPHNILSYALFPLANIKFEPEFGVKIVVEKLLDGSIKEGDVIPHGALWRMSGLSSRPFNSLEEMTDQLYNFQFLQPFKKMLLQVHKIDLEALQGVGYRVIPTNERVSHAVQDNAKWVHRTVRRTKLKLVNLPPTISADDARRAANEAARMSALRAFARKETT